tara:strand:+ start:948 stop:1184 length:237 start_codon:yes stop_codon:yes gene_type:complete
MRTKEYNSEYKSVKVTEIPISENARQRGWTHGKQVEEVWPEGQRKVSRVVFVQYWPEIAEEWDSAAVKHVYYSKFYPA